ncbi:hypothetical protein PVAP13_3KG317081 [Panicum virgatum]|uniref:Uncharacterized protein n=1 Tax=Panicum virgatum TaxID=38727 RepID=A0A8T0UVU9_PANVG|nr:hypothetical protein PVAP13_3KG317081 [Panicum virgatum]
MWLTTAVLVYDIAVEAYCPQRVMRQFGQRQEFPVPTALERVVKKWHAVLSHLAHHDGVVGGRMGACR